MGYADVVTHSIWLFAVFVLAAQLGPFAFSAAGDVWDAGEDAREGRLRFLDTEVEVTSTAWDAGAGRFTATVVNRGSVALDPAAVDFLLEGVPSSASITVDGSAVDAWLPGETATFVVDGLATVPLRVLVVTENGRREFAEHVLRLLHSANVSTLDRGVPETAFKNGDTVTVKVTVHDEFDVRMSGVEVSVTLTSPSGGNETLGPATTDASGVATMTRKLTGSDPSGVWTLDVASLVKADYSEDLAASEQASNTFTK